MIVWDTHDPASDPTGSYEGAQGLRNQGLWPALSFLASELKSRPGSSPGSKLIDETTVVVLSEMTRTPKKNAAGGKDHWPYTSALVFGAGVRAGQTMGYTNDSLTSEPIDLATGQPDAGGVTLESSHFVAGVLKMVGVDPGAHLPLTPIFSAMMEG